MLLLKRKIFVFHQTQFTNYNSLFIKLLKMLHLHVYFIVKLSKYYGVI